MVSDIDIPNAAMKVLVLLATLFFWGAPAATGAAPSAAKSAPETLAKAWLIKLDDKVIGAHLAQQALPPASLTKIMTALIWLQKPSRQDEELTISHRAAAQTGSAAGLKSGEKYFGRELLAAMLISSANDACIALAEHAAGSVEAFVADMNRAAKAIGLSRTHFANPCGHDAPGHTSTAKDLMHLTEVALTNRRFSDLVATPEWTLKTSNGTNKKILKTSNALIGRFDGTRGVKTGYTAAAGKCLIALVERDGHRVLLVMLGAKNRWWAAHGLIDQAFARIGR